MLFYRNFFNLGAQFIRRSRKGMNHEEPQSLRDMRFIPFRGIPSSKVDSEGSSFTKLPSSIRILFCIKTLKVTLAKLD